jgi:hypothetical protein
MAFCPTRYYITKILLSKDAATVGLRIRLYRTELQARNKKSPSGIIEGGNFHTADSEQILSKERSG